MIRVLVAATSVIMRAGLEALINASVSLEVIGSSTEQTTLAQQIENLAPDVVLMELEVHNEEALPDLSWLNVLRQDIAIVVLVDNPPNGWLAEALRTGVRAILPRTAQANEIVSAVEASAYGLVVLDSHTAAELLAGLPSAQTLPGTGSHTLTAREIEILGMLAEGLGNKTIAARLGISEHTVKFHIASIFAKLNATSRTEAVTIGIRQGLIML
ncbi:MAG: response regulator transcription factor [Acidobacteriota bacterium]